MGHINTSRVLTALTLVLVLFADSTRAGACTNNPYGQCLNLDSFYCAYGHKISNSGCGWQESCCYPYAAKPPAYKPGVDQCGITSINAGSRIIGGKDATVQEYPWMASVQIYNQPMCGGSIISDRWILTAAHCVIKDLDHASVVLGSTKTALSWLDYKKRYQVSKVIRHNRYTIGNAGAGYDIALIKLARPISVGTTSTRRICLPSPSDTFDNSVCAISGWGYTHEPVGEPTSDGGSPTLRQGIVPVLPVSNCEYYLGRMAPGTLCAGYRSGGEDSCQGDSGGPLVCKGRDGVWRQAGVVSVGKGCGQKYSMGIYTDVMAFRTWIDYVMNTH